jgi:hypothetical protein
MSSQSGSSQSGPPWLRTSASRRGFRSAGSDLRVSDAERHDVADRLSRHYADGRLDQVELNERLEQAMGAKTRGDLGGLFTDLPPLDASDHRSISGRRGVSPQLRHVLLIVLVVLIAGSIAQHVIRLDHPWLLIGALVAVWLLRHDLLRRRS